MANTDLLNQGFPAHAANAITTTPVAFTLNPGGPVTVTAGQAFYTWFSDTEDVAVPAGAMDYAADEKPEFKRRKSKAKKFCLVAAVSTSGTAKLLQE